MQIRLKEYQNCYLNLVLLFMLVLAPSVVVSGVGDTLYVDHDLVGDSFDITDSDDLLYSKVIVGSRGPFGTIDHVGGWLRLEPFFSSSGSLKQSAELVLTGRANYHLFEGYLRVHGDVSLGFPSSGWFYQGGGSVWIESHPNASGGSLYLGRNTNYDGSPTGGSPYGSYFLDGGDLYAESEYIGGDIFSSGYAEGLFQQRGGFNRTESLSLANSSDGIGEYYLTGGSLQAGEEVIGNAGEGIFSQIGGSTNHVEEYLIIARLPESTGAYTLADGGRLTVDNTTIVGSTGTGSFTLDSNATHSSADLLIGHSRISHSTYTIDGNGTLEVSGSESIGVSGSGTFNQNSGTNIANILSLGVNSGSSGTYVMEGGCLTADTEIIGYSGQGSFSQFEGSTNNTRNLFLGQGTNGSGFYFMGGGSLSTENVFIPQGTFRQNRGVHTVSQKIHVGTNDPSTTGQYLLRGGELNASQVEVGWGDNLIYSGGSLDANIANYGNTYFLGSGETLVHNGNIHNYRFAELSTNNFEFPSERANVQMNGNINIDHDSYFNIWNTDLQVTGDVINNGIIKTTNSDVQWSGTFTNWGVYDSDPSINDFENLVVEELGYLIGSTGDHFIITGNLINRSTQYDRWNTTDAYLGFEGSGTHELFNLDIREYVDEHLWNTVEVREGDLLLQGMDFYIENLLLSENTSLLLDGVTLYYDNFMDYSNNIFFSNGGRLVAMNNGAPVPEPATMLLFGTGLVGLVGSRLRKKKG